MNNPEPSPALSVVLPTSRGLANVARTLRALGAQTVRHRLELVIVAPSDSITLDPAMTEGFAGVQVIGVDNVTSSSNQARVAGIRIARAPIVALAEDHSFPEPGWAEALLAGHMEGTWAAVGPVVCNGNPATAVSWANFLLEYGPWTESARRGAAAHLPGHNSSYRRDLLLAYGEKLEALMEAESILQWDLRHHGHQLLLEPAARTHHLNFSRLLSSISLRFNVGRQFAGTRSAEWPPLKRLLYVLGAPLIPLVRLRRSVALLVRWPARRGLLPRVFPVLAAAVAIDGLGEMVGYAAGPGSSSSILGGIEFDRRRSLTRQDQQAYDAENARYRSRV
jgi:Glycosyltransferase like family 2